MTSTTEPAPHRWPIPTPLRGLRGLALTLITLLVVVATAVAFIESYEGLYRWALDHGLSGVWARVWPLQVDAFIAVGELALFVGIVDRWPSHRFAWVVTAAGLAFSVWGNVGHVTTELLSFKVTAAVPPLAAAAGLMVGLQVLKRIVSTRHDTADAEPDRDRSTAVEDSPTPSAPPFGSDSPATVAPVTPKPVTPARSATPARRKTGQSGTRRRSPAAPPDVDDLLPLGWQIAAVLDKRGEPLTRERLQAAIREAGQSISTDRARALLKRLRTEAPAEPVNTGADRTSDQPSTDDERDAAPIRQDQAAPRHPAADTTHEVAQA